jgi:hypothetical protein
MDLIKENKKSVPMRKLHSVHALLQESRFVGSFEDSKGKYLLTYIPSKVEVTNKRIVLTGNMQITSTDGSTKTLKNIGAQLAATQGGASGSITRFQLSTGTVQTGAISTSPQKQSIEGESNRPLIPERAKENPTEEVEVQFTGPRSFVGVMYFHLSPLNGKELNIPFDMSRVQLNVRMAPVDQVARDLQSLYSDLVAAVYGETYNEKDASIYLKEINAILN